MRTITDQNGCLWDVVTGRESYGARTLLFCPRDGGEVRKIALDAVSTFAATAEFQRLSDHDLCQRLARSEIWC